MFTALRAVSSRHHRCIRRSQPPFTTIKSRGLSAQSRASRVRTIPDSDAELPESKGTRLESGTASKPVRKGVSSETQAQGQPQSENFEHKKPQLPKAYSLEDVLWPEIKSVLGPTAIEEAIEKGVEFKSPFICGQEVEVVVKSLSPSGDAVAVPVEEARSKIPWAIVVPFSLPGEVVRARVYQNARMYSVAELVAVTTPNMELRDDSRAQCRYFGRCGICRYQMLSYDSQLSFKRDVIVNAYKNFSGLPESSVPTVLPTVGSPLQYGYRTKISPTFRAAPKSLRKEKLLNKTDQDEVAEQPDWLKIGFGIVGTNKRLDRGLDLDIEECPIATPVINQALTSERANVIRKAYTYKRGEQLVLRESLDPTIVLPPEITNANESEVDGYISEALNKHVCITSLTAKAREKVGEFLFEFPASSFFQKNNSILVPLTDYVKEAIFPSGSEKPRPTHLVDAYCDSGLFAIALSPYFKTIAGIGSSDDSIRSAQHNVSLNQSLQSIPAFKNLVSPTSTTSSTLPTISQPDISFHSGTESDIFSSVSSFPRHETVIVIHPPKQGCKEEFIRQVVKFRPAVLVYVSCNVHSQARDIGMLLKMVDEAEDNGEEKEKGGRYAFESLRGFDSLPQTRHVESVAVLRLI